MTGPELSRRRMLGSAGAAGLAGLLAACGGNGTAGGAATSDGVGSAAWWARQKLQHTVNFANWPYYIDVLHNRHPTLQHFTALTGISVSYTEPIIENLPFYAKIRPSLQAKQYTGYDLIVSTNNSPPLGDLIQNGWLIPLDRSMMTNFNTYAGPLIRNPSWDPGNKYTMAWQSGWTAIGYNGSAVKDPGSSVGLLFEKRYAGKVGMMADPQELGSLGLLAIGVEPVTSTESDWVKAAKLLRLQRSDGIVRGYYDQSYIDYLKSGEIWVSQAFSGDIFQADTNSKVAHTKSKPMACNPWSSMKAATVECWIIALTSVEIDRDL